MSCCPGKAAQHRCHGAALSTGLCCRELDLIFQLTQGKQTKDVLESWVYDLLLYCRPGE